MAKYSYSNLVKGISFDDAKKYLLDLAKSWNIPTTAFQSGDVMYTNLNVVAEILSIFADSVSELSKQIYLTLSSGSYLDLIAENHFNITRHEATPSIVDALLVFSGATPQIKNVGDIIITIDGIEYRNNESFNIIANGSAVVEFKSYESGSATRVSTSVKPVFITNLLGVDFSTFETNIYTTNVSYGQDIESDSNLILRCQSKWGELSFNAPVDAYKYYILNSYYTIDGINNSEITRIQIDQSKAQASGRISISCATDVGACLIGSTSNPQPSDNALAAANIVVQEKRAIGSWVNLKGTPYKDIATKIVCVYDTSLNKESVEVRKTNLVNYISEYVGNLPVGDSVIISELIRSCKDNIIGLYDIIFEYNDSEFGVLGEPMENIILTIDNRRYAGLMVIDYNYQEI